MTGDNTPYAQAVAGASRPRSCLGDDYRSYARHTSRLISGLWPGACQGWNFAGSRVWADTSRVDMNISGTPDSLRRWSEAAQLGQERESGDRKCCFRTRHCTG